MRYGVFSGAANDAMIAPVRKRQFPIIGDCGGIWPWIQLDDAAAATGLALEHEGPANIVDDDPAPVREWLPVLAQSLDAKPPLRLPTWLARPLAGEAAVVILTEARGASNCEGEARAGMDAAPPELAVRLRRGLRQTVGAHIQAPIARPREGQPPAIRLSMTQSRRAVERPHVLCGTIVGGFASPGG